MTPQTGSGQRAAGSNPAGHLPTTPGTGQAPGTPPTTGHRAGTCPLPTGHQRSTR